ncbi:MAG: PH domain-containing protein, partial [Paramuribaculum sp.]|nr:PH domain-containing protein [Paramuribaculum sp.]
RETTTIPLDKIHTMRTKRGFIYRLLEMRGITFDTLASKTEEIELILSDVDWLGLKNMIEEEERVPQTKTETVDGDASKELRFNNMNLIKGAFCQNHFKAIALLLGGVAAVCGQLQDLSDNAIIDIVDYVGSRADSVTGAGVMGIAGIVAVVYIVAMLLWMGQLFLRYYDMTLQTENDQLLFQSGLISRYSSRLAYDKICTVYVKRNILEKKFGCCTLMLKQALNATVDKGDSEVKIYGSNTSEHFLQWWLGEDYASSPTMASAKSGNGLLFHTIKFDLLISLVSTIVLWHFGLHVWILLPIVYMLIALAKGICAIRRSHITLKDSYIIISNGRFADIHNFVKYSSVEVVGIKRTPLTPLFHKVSLVLSTNGTTFTVRSLPAPDAHLIYEMLLNKQH